MNGMEFFAQQLAELKLDFLFHAEKQIKERYELDLIQLNLNDEGNFEYSGGERYVINSPQCSNVSAGEDVTLPALCKATLAAVPEFTNAAYAWRNNLTGELIASTRTIEVDPSETTTYEVEMSQANGCISYDFVTVTRNFAGGIPCLPALGRTRNENAGNTLTNNNTNEILFAAFPNPFLDNLTLVYSLPENLSSADLKIYEAASGKTVFTAKLDVKQSGQEISNLNIAPGLYICTIRTNDGASKQFKLVKAN